MHRISRFFAFTCGMKSSAKLGVKTPEGSVAARDGEDDARR